MSRSTFQLRLLLTRPYCKDPVTVTVLPTSHRRKVRMLFEQQDKRHVSSDSFVFTYVLFDRTLSILLMFFVVYWYRRQYTTVIVNRQLFNNSLSITTQALDPQEMGDLCQLRQSLHEESLLQRSFASLVEIQVMCKQGGYYLQQPQVWAVQLGGGVKWLVFRRKTLGEMVIRLFFSLSKKLAANRVFLFSL